MQDMRIGLGYDVHPLVNGLPLILGGVRIPHPFGLAGYSDGDVLIHAVIDALLGAAALGDIGFHFPAGDPRFKGIDSLILLKETSDMIGEAGYTVGNIDSVVIAEQPRIAPYIPEMRRKIAETLCIQEQVVSVKATTTEKLGFTGRGEGIAAQAVALIMQNAECRMQNWEGNNKGNQEL